jgi:hypothetical protein
MTSIVLKLIRNSIFVVIFCVGALLFYYFVSGFFIRQGMGIGPAHRAQDEGAVNVLFFLIVPYASLLSGYASAEEGLRRFEARHLAQNPMFLVGPALIIWLGVQGVPLAGVVSGLAFFCQFATTMSRLPPPARVEPASLDARFTALDPNDAIQQPQTESMASTWARRAIDFVSLFLVIAPVTAILTIVVFASLPASMLLPPSGAGRSLASAEMRLLSAAFLMIPLALVGWIVVRPALYARNMLARARKMHVQSGIPGAKTALYLRQFSRDKKSEVTRPRSLAMQVMYAIPGLTMALHSATRLRLEDTVARAFDGVSNFVAADNPDEIIPPLGADRFYLELADWKQELASKIRKSDVLVMLVEFSESTEWEIAELLKDENRCRTILCLPEPERSPSWSDRWKYLQSKGLPLPDVDRASAAVVFPDIEGNTVIRVRGHWGFWGDALRSAVVSGLSGGRVGAARAWRRRLIGKAAITAPVSHQKRWQREATNTIERVKSQGKSTPAALVTPLIMVWLEVRVLPGPPRTRAILEISRRRAKCPDLAGFLYHQLVSETADL